MKPFSASFLLPNPSRSRWKLLSLAGVRDTKSALDTLKKISPSGGFWQVFPIRAVASVEHLAWAAYSTLSSLESNTARFSAPELEFLSRVSGCRQWERAKEKAGLKPSDDEMVVVWVGPEKALSAAEFLRSAKKWGLKPQKLQWGSDRGISVKGSVSNETMAIEQSALVEIQ